MNNFYSEINSFLNNQNLIDALVILLSFGYFFYRKSKIHYRIKAHRNKEGVVVYKAEHRVWLFGKWNADYLGVHSSEQKEKNRALYILVGWQKKEDTPSTEEKEGGNFTHEYFTSAKVRELEKNLFKRVENV